MSPTIQSALSSNPLDLKIVSSGLNYGLDTITSGLDASSYNGQVTAPFVGTDLSSGASPDILSIFKQYLMVPLQDAITNGGITGASPHAQDVVSCLASVLNANLGAGGSYGCQGGFTASATGQNLLNSPVVVTAICSTPCGPFDPAAPASAIQDLRVQINMGHTTTTQRTFNLGFPGLRLASDGDGITLGAAWGADFTFGISRTAGFYLAPDPANGSGGSLLTVVTGTVDLPHTLTADMAFLQATIQNNQAASSAAHAASIHVGLGISDTLSLASLSSGQSPLDALYPAVGVAANMNVTITTGLHDGESYGFPSVRTNFIMQWQYELAKSGGSLPPAPTPTIAFNNVELDAGAFVTKLLAPTTRQLRKVTKPLQPVIDTIEAPFPGVSDLAALVGKPPITVLSLMDADGIDTGAIKRIITLVKIVNALAVPADGAHAFVPLGSFTVTGALALGAPLTPDQDRLSSLYVGGVQLSTFVPRSVTDFAKNLTQNKAVQDALQNVCGGGAIADCGGGAGSLTDDHFTAQTGLTFPFLKDSKQIFTLLLGKDIDLVRYDTGILDSGDILHLYEDYLIFLGPLPLHLTVSGHIAFTMHLIIAYDTSGIRKVLTEGSSGEHLFDGIYLDTIAADGSLINTATATGHIGGSAAVGATFFGVGAEAGLKGAVDLNVLLRLHDPDGDSKVRINEIYNELHEPLCLFDYAGKLRAYLAAYASAGIGFLSAEYDAPIIDTTLLDFEALSAQLHSPGGACDANATPSWANPKETTRDPLNPSFDLTGYLVINVGPYTADRHVRTDVVDEKVIVRQIRQAVAVDGVAGLVTQDGFSVTMFGITQDYIGLFKGVYVDGGSGNDDISFLSGQDLSVTPSQVLSFQAATMAIGGDGNNTIHGGDGPNTIYGAYPDAATLCSDMTQCSNKLYGGARDNTIYGGPGADVIHIPAGSGVRYADGRGGNDSISAGGGTGTLIGGDGNDSISTSAGDYVIYGDNPSETSCAGGATCNDTISAGQGHTIEIGGPGANVMNAQDCQPTAGGACTTGSILIGGSLDSGVTIPQLQGWFAHSVDVPYSYTATDIASLCSASGSAGDGTNRIEGGLGPDLLMGGAGNDLLLGDASNDRLCGRGGNDILVGGPGANYLDGGAGNDALLGSNGTIHDTVALQTALATTGGGHDQAVISQVQLQQRPTDGSNFLVGGEGNNFLWGGGGSDTLYGAHTDPTQCGAPGSCNNYLVGGDSEDTLYGGPGNDVLYGDNADGSCSDPAGACSDTLYGEAGNDEMHGGPSGMTMANLLVGGDGNDTMYGDGGLRGSDGSNAMQSAALYNSVLYGDNHDGACATPPSCADTMYGGQGQAYMEGGPGSNTLYAGVGPTDMIGGSSEAGRSNGGGSLMGPDGQTYSGNLLFGGPSNDVMCGANCAITRTGELIPVTPATLLTTPARLVTKLDVPLAASSCLSDTTTFGNTYMDGGTGITYMYGGNGNNSMHGGLGLAHHIEGGAGANLIYGDAGQNDLIGGTGRLTDVVSGSLLTTGNDPRATPAQDGLCASANVIFGDNGAAATDMAHPHGQPDVYGRQNGPSTDRAAADVIAGANATIDRPISGGAWIVNAFDQSISRTVHLLDVGTTTLSALSGTSSNDALWGGPGDDRIFGQGGSDYLVGANGDNYLSGGAGNNIMYGNNPPDPTHLPSQSPAGWCSDPQPQPRCNADMIGGSSLANAISGNSGAVTANPNDQIGASGNLMYGGAGNAVMCGDNCAITRPLTALGAWQALSYDNTPVRTMTKFNIPVAPSCLSDPRTFANDYMDGGSGNAYLYGGNGNDSLHGGLGADHIEGGPGSSTIYGDGGQNDLIGGTGRPTDVISGSLLTTGDGAGSIQPVNGMCHGAATMFGGDGSTTITETLPSTLTTTLDAQTLARLPGGANYPGLDVYGLNHLDTGATAKSATVMLGDNGTLDRPVSNGSWIINSWDQSISRTIRLNDVATITDTAPLINHTHGNDVMFGETGNNIMYGQGGNTYMNGGLGDTYMEGGSGNNTMFGGGGQKDMIGGTGRITSWNPTLGGYATDPPGGTPNRISGWNVMYSGDDPLGGSRPTDSASVMIGGNGIVTRPLTAAGLWTPINYVNFTYPRPFTVNTTMAASTGTIVQPTSRWARVIQMVDTQPMSVTVGGAVYANANSHLMFSNGGDDDMIGGWSSQTEGIPAPLVNVPNCQFTVAITVPGNIMCGGTGDDAMAGAQAMITDVVESGNRTQVISIPAPFITETNFPQGQLTRLVQQTQITLGGDSYMDGGHGNNWMHGGAGNDVMFGGAGNNRMFGDDGKDYIVGGTGHNHVYGGYGNDFLDVLPAQAVLITGTAFSLPTNAALWFAIAPTRTLPLGIDYSYAGWGRNVLQATYGGPGPQLGDRLIAWVGNYNLYLTCPGAYGEGVITRQHSPAMQQYLQNQATGDGAVDVTSGATALSGSYFTGTGSGFDDLAMVYTTDIAKDNAGAAFKPGTPGHFVCP